MNLVNNPPSTVLWAKPSRSDILNHLQLRSKAICFGRKAQGNSGEIKLKNGSDSAIVDWHDIHLFLVPF